MNKSLTEHEKLDLNLAITAFRLDQMIRAQKVFSFSIENMDSLDDSRPDAHYFEQLINENHEADRACEASLREGLEYAEEENIEHVLANHDCTNGPEDGCAVCSKYLPDYVPSEEEEEEEYWDASEWDEVAYDDNPFDPDEYDIALNGQEEQLALLQLENEHDGYSRGGAIIL